MLYLIYPFNIRKNKVVHNLYRYLTIIYFQKVPEMEAEYFPPKEDVILQNETPTDLYILVSGAVVSELNIHLIV